MTVLKRTSALVMALAGILLAPAATATRGSPEQLVPDALPIPVDSLWLSVEPAFGGGWAVTEGNAAPATFAPTDYFLNQASIILPDRGAVFDFPVNRKPFKVSSTTRTLLPRVAPSDPSGMTIAFSYRANVGQKDGFYPLWSLGARGAPWRMALVLNDGRPQVSLRHASLQLFDETSVPQTGRTARVDDSQWHHIALRVTREKCSGACPSIVDVGYPVQPARFTLYVDGQWRNEEVALAPLDLDELGLGELAVTSPYAQENFWVGPDRLATYAWMRDILLFEAPLSDFEIAELEGWTTAGYTAQFPGGARARVEALAPGVQTTPFQVGPSPMPASDLLAYGGKSVGASSETFLTTGATTFAWVKVDQHAPAAVGRFWLGSTWVSVAYTAEGMRATCGSAAATAPYPRAALNRPQLLTLISTGGSSTLYQDGYKVLSVPCVSSSATGSIGFQLTSGTGAWLLWTGSFTHPITIDEVLKRAAPGPALWNGAKAGDTQLLDLTGRETLRTEPSPLGSRAVAGGRFTNEAYVATGATARFPTLPYGFSMAAEGALGPGGGDAPVTVSFEVVDPNETRDSYYQLVPAGTTPVAPKPVRYQLAAREYWVSPSFDQRVNFSATIECRWTAHTFLGTYYQKQCWYEIVAGVGPGKAGRRFRVNDQRARPFEKHHLAIAWDGKPRTILPGVSGGAVTRVEPLVAIDGVRVNQRTRDDHNPIEDLGEVPALPADTAGVRARWSFGPAGKGSVQQAFAAADSPWAGVYAVDLYDVRVYPFAHVDVASIFRARGGACAEAGRQSTASAAPWHGDYCGDCAASQYRLAGTTVATRECRTPEPYGVDCASSTECEGGGACWQGRCLTTSQAQSQADCTAIGRTSVAQGSSWRCADCKAGLRPKGAASTNPDSWELQCSWQPDKNGGDACASDAECKSHWCLPAQSGQVASGVHKGQGSREVTKSDSWAAYSITCRQQAETFTPTLFDKAWSIPGTCAYEKDFGAAECQARAAKSVVRETTAPDGSTIVGVQCLDGPAGQCIPGFEKRWSVLSPQACVEGLKASTQSITGECDVNWVNSKTNHTSIVDDPRRAAMWTGNADLTRATLKQAFLGDSSRWVTADYARLLNAGVGSRLLEYAAGTADDRTHLNTTLGNFGPLRWCADDFGDRPTWATYANGKNAQVCEPKLRKNGETCPPPGSEGTGFQPWQFCESSFCDTRGTGTCTDGGQVLREDQGNGDAEGKPGKEGVKFGIVRVDDTRIDLSKDTVHAGMGEASAGYKAAISQTHVPCILGEKFPPVDLMHIEMVIDKQKPTCGKTVFTFQVMGVTFNAPPPDPVAGSCTIASATIGTNGEICADGPSCTPPSWENLKNLASWTGRIPSFKYCIPLDDDTGNAKGSSAAGPKQPAPATLPEKKKTILAGPVPIVIGIGLTLDPCVNAAFGFSDNGARHALSQVGLPQLEITPSIAIGVEASAGVGVEEDQGGGAALGVSVGVKIALTIVELRFPIRWALALNDVEKAGVKVPGLFRLQSVVSLSMAVEILSGWMGLYVSISLGPFGIEWVLKLLGWTGIVFQAPLTNPITADLMTIDFRSELNAARAGQQVRPKPHCDGSRCSGQGN